MCINRNRKQGESKDPQKKELMRVLFRNGNKTIRIVTILLMFALAASSIGCMIRWIITGQSQFDTIGGMLINSLVACLGFFAIYRSIENDKEIKIYEYIEDYNFQFLTQKDFMDVERILESCFNKYIEIENSLGNTKQWKKENEDEFLKYCDNVFGCEGCMYSDNKEAKNTRIDSDGAISEKYQKIINYLVYLESFVPLLQRKQIGYEEIDDLFGYRYFIAVNNPILQQNELLKYPKYYKGCINAYDAWKSFREDDIPMAHFDLKTQLEAYEKEHKEKNKRNNDD